MNNKNVSVSEQLFLRMRIHNTLLCVGLDPDLRKIPSQIAMEYKTDEERVFEFLKGVVDAVGRHVCAYKAQKAFFDLLPGGHDVLQAIVHYVHTTQHGTPIFVDCKIGDIENTMIAYIDNIFGSIHADGVVVNPYMGDDVITPLIEWKDKAIIVLVKTSNVSGGIVQDVVLQDGRMMWQYLLDLVVHRWNTNGNVIPVLSSTVKLDMMKLRFVIPETMPILLAGVGAQGGDVHDIRVLLNTERLGVFVNSSRAILYHEYSESWRVDVETSAIIMKESLNKFRIP